MFLNRPDTRTRLRDIHVFQNWLIDNDELVLPVNLTMIYFHIKSYFKDLVGMTLNSFDSSSQRIIRILILRQHHLLKRNEILLPIVNYFYSKTAENFVTQIECS